MVFAVPVKDDSGTSPHAVDAEADASTMDDKGAVSYAFASGIDTGANEDFYDEVAAGR